MILCWQCDSNPEARPNNKRLDTEVITPTQRDRIVLFGDTECAPSPQVLHQATSDMHFILWKFVLIHFTAVDLDNKKFDRSEVIKGALRRYVSKANAISAKVSLKRKLADARQKDVDISNENKLLYPLGSIDAEGVISWDYWFRRCLNIYLE